MTTTRLEPGTPAPDFSLTDQDGSTVTLADLRGTGAILFFYPAAMTPGCTTEACDFRDSIGPIQAAGYRVLGVSRGLTYDLLSDPDHAVHSAYGAWGEKVNYGKKIEGVIRSTIVLDGEGIVEHALYNVKATGHVARIRKLLGLD